MKKITTLLGILLIVISCQSQILNEKIRVSEETVLSVPDSLSRIGKNLPKGKLVLNRENGLIFMVNDYTLSNKTLASSNKTLVSSKASSLGESISQSVLSFNAGEFNIISPQIPTTKYSSFYQNLDTFNLKTVGAYPMGVQRTAGISSEAGLLSLYFNRTGVDAYINLYDGEISVKSSHGIQYTPILYENLNTNSLVPKSYVDSVAAVLLDSIGLDTSNLKIGYGLEILGDSINLSQEVFDSIDNEISKIPVYTGSNTITIVGDSINVSQEIYDTLNTKIPSTGYLNSNIYLIGKDTLNNVILDTLGQFFTRAVDTANNNYTELSVMGSAFDINVNTEDNTISSYLAIDTDTIDIGSYGAINYTSLGLDSLDIVVAGVDSTFKGVLYAADYSANYTNRSLVDRDNAMKYTVIETEVPASATAEGVKGAVIISVGYIYICIDTNTWVRVAITTWE